MSKLVRRVAWGGVVVLCAMIAVAILYSPKREPITSWHCNRMRTIETDWRSVWDMFYQKTPVGQQRDEYDNATKSADDVLAGHLSSTNLRHLAATAGALPVFGKDRSDFTEGVLNYMVRSFLKSGDSEGLVTLLSTRFSDRAGFQVPIEYALVIWGEKLKDPILLLGKAYSKCQNPEVRRHLAIVVRRAFVGSGIHGKDDTDFVKNAMQWYEENKNHLMINPNGGPYCVRSVSYDDLPEAYGAPPRSRKFAYFAPARLWAEYEKRPLFVEKSSSVSDGNTVK